MIHRTALTLVEIVLAIVILGVLVGVVSPALLRISGQSTDKAVRRTLAGVRNAIERYADQNDGDLPPCSGRGDDFKLALQPYLRGSFPACPVSPSNSDVVPTTGVTAPTNESGWMFNTDDGAFVVNSTARDSSTPSVAYSTY